MYQDILKRKEKIIITAIDILDEAGVKGLTMKEIARRQNITEPAIYRQFNSKKDLFLAMLDRFSSYDEIIKNTVLENDMYSKRGIVYFATAYAEYYQNYPQIASIIFAFDMLKYDTDVNKRMCDILKKRYDTLFEIIARALEEEADVATDKGVLTDVVFGVIWSTTFLWKMEGCKFNLKERMIKVIESILKK